MKYLVKLYASMSILLWITVGCTNYSQPNQNSSLTPTLEFLPQTITPSATVPTVTLTPMSTLRPVLDIKNANELVLQLLRDNSNCRFSCWWGISPGETTSQDVISGLNSFSAIAVKNSLRIDHGSIHLQIQNGNGLLSTFIEYDSSGGTVDSLIVGLSQLIKNEEGGYDQVHGDSDFASATQSLMLSRILTLYGQPKEVLISTYSLQPLGWPVFFDIQLFYPDYGFLMVYHTLMEFSRDGYIKGCPSNSSINIGLWKPEKYLLVSDVPRSIRENISDFSLLSYLQINEATDMSIQDFYNTFKDDEALCLETPAGIWPFPGQ